MKQDIKTKGFKMGFDKPFSITNLLTQATLKERKRIKELVEGNIKKIRHNVSAGNISFEEAPIYNQALKDIIKILSK